MIYTHFFRESSFNVFKIQENAAFNICKNECSSFLIFTKVFAFYMMLFLTNK